jgi:hypothetical protein
MSAMPHRGTVEVAAPAQFSGWLNTTHQTVKAWWASSWLVNSANRRPLLVRTSTE